MTTRRGAGLRKGEPKSGSFANDAWEEESQIGAIRSGDGFRNGDPKVGSLAKDACDADTQFKGEDLNDGDGKCFDTWRPAIVRGLRGVGVGVDMGDVLPDMKNSSSRSCSSPSSSFNSRLDRRRELEAARYDFFEDSRCGILATDRSGIDLASSSCERAWKKCI